MRAILVEKGLEPRSGVTTACGVGPYVRADAERFQAGELPRWARRTCSARDPRRARANGRWREAAVEPQPARSDG